ncbi:MAG: DUF3786 domain-containing protein [Candidatus Omnitrophica bacterium]|nr:DUF3786 domain-containing protein [Candidatus Omnitrophota bacterium]
MSYALALNKAWTDLERGSQSKKYTVKFLSDEYSVDIAKRQILSLSCNAPSKEFLSILILHYLEKKLKGLPELSHEGMSYKEIPESLGYYPRFKIRVFEPLLRKYGARPEAVLEKLESLAAKKLEYGDVGILVEALENVPILVTFWRADTEFGPEVNVLFDRSILQIFCTEDIIVLAEFIARTI